MTEKIRQKLLNRDTLFVLFVILFSALILCIPTGFEGMHADNSVRCKGLVLEVDNSDVQQFGIVKEGIQGLYMEIQNGPYTGERVHATNTIVGKMELDKIFEEGDKALVVLSIDDDAIAAATVIDHYRITTEMILFILFALLLILFAAWTGAKALISFVFAAVVIWKILLPCLLKGYDPILVSIGVVTLLIAAIIFLVGGLNKKGTVAFFGSLLGLLLTCGLALLFGPLLHLHGAVRPYSETLLYSGYVHLNLTSIFLAGIFVASSGAVMDLAMDVSASMNEVSSRNPDMSVRELIASGFSVGRAVVGTMVTTLLLAYSSAYTTMLMVFMAQGIPLIHVFNLNYVASEILNTLVGSFGLVTVAPFTALVGGLIYTRGK